MVFASPNLGPLQHIIMLQMLFCDQTGVTQRDVQKSSANLYTNLVYNSIAPTKTQTRANTSPECAGKMTWFTALLSTWTWQKRGRCRSSRCHRTQPGSHTRTSNIDVARTARHKTQLTPLIIDHAARREYMSHTTRLCQNWTKMFHNTSNTALYAHYVRSPFFQGWAQNARLRPPFGLVGNIILFIAHAGRVALRMAYVCERAFPPLVRPSVCIECGGTPVARK